MVNTITVHVAEDSPLAAVVETASRYADVTVSLNADGHVSLAATNGTGWKVCMSLFNNTVASPGSPGLLKSFSTADDALSYWVGQVIGLAGRHRPRGSLA